jgi:hypothetical protein
MRIMERRKRTFPVRWVKTKPTPSNPGGIQMFYAHEWEAYQKSLPPDQRDDALASPTEPAPETAAKTNAESPGAVALSPSESITSPASSASIASPAPSIHRNFSTPPDFSRHARRCSVCSHPDRDAIEGDFIRWRSPGQIAQDYKIADRSSIYRHAHSTGLFAWRKRELGRTLESILESCEDVPLESADVIIRAARIYSHLDENGYWFEPPRTTFIFHGPAPSIYPLEGVLSTNSARAQNRSAQEASGGEEKANRNIHQFKNSVNSMNPEEKANS